MANINTRNKKTEFGRRLKSLMLERGWNQSELARYADMGRDNVSGYINGKYLPNAKHLHKLARALHVDPQTLLPDTEALPLPPHEEEYLEIRDIPGRNECVALRINKRLPPDIAMKVMQVIHEARH